MFNLINSQVYELQQQQESLLLLEKQHQQKQQQQQQQQQNCQNSKMKNLTEHYNSTCYDINNTNHDNNNYGAYKNSNNSGNSNNKSLNNLQNLINNNNNNNNNTNNRKKKSNYGSYYRQEKLKATANFIEKFLKNEVSSSNSNSKQNHHQQQQRQQQKQSQQQETSLIEIDKQNNNNCNNPNINFTYTYQSLNDYHHNNDDKYKLEYLNNKEQQQNNKELILKQQQRCNNNSVNNNSNNNSNNNELINVNNYNGNFHFYNHDNEDSINNYNIENVKNLNSIEEDDSQSDITALGPNSLQIDNFNNLLDKNSSDTMPSLSPSQSSTDQSSSTTTTTATSLGTNNLSSSSTNDRVSITKRSIINNYDGTTIDRTMKKVNNNINNNNNNTQSSVLHRKKLLQVVTFLDQQNQRLERELENEKIRRNEELSRIVKSLLYFEAKLKSEKKVINQKLYEKDDEIAKLVRLNTSLKEKLNEKDPQNNFVEEVENGLNQLEYKYPESLFCSNCRKEFYGLNEKCDNWTQTSGKITDCRSSCKGENNNNNNSTQNNNSTEHCSSSDETLSSSFYGARRSIRYTSKRTFGTFREYMRSRSMNIDDPAIDNNHNLSEDENRSTLSRDEFPSQTNNRNNKKDKLFSSAIERLHGVRRVSSFEFDSSETENRNSHRKNFSSSGPETDHEHTNSPNDEGIEDDDIDEDDEDYDDAQENSVHYEGANVGVITTGITNIKEFSEISVKQDFEASTDDWYASASDGDDDQNSSVCRTKSYGYNAVNPVLECVNQILLQQSMEECINERIINNNNKENHYDNNCNGPISLESVDNNAGGFSICSGGSSNKDNNNNTNTGPSNNGSGNGSVSRKRVHFSTKNSMVHVPRDDDEILEQKSCSFSDTLNSSITSEHHSNNLNYESIYSNEYEPIGSEHNSSNLYVDMESKLDQDEKLNLRLKNSQQQQYNNHSHQQQLQAKQPPALPPKPANLIKFKRGIKISPVPPTQRHSIDSIPLQSTHTGTKLIKELLDKVDPDKNYNKYGSTEPDYCSISEVNVAIKTMQIVADVHKSNDTNSVASSTATSISGDNSDTMSQKTSDDAEEIFADIPKLPNVAAIIAPSKSKSNNKSLKNSNDSSKRLDINDNFNIPNHQSSISIQLQQKPQLNQQQPQLQQQKPQQQQQSQLRPQSLQLYRPKSPGQVQRKHVPNILAEINKKIQQAGSPGSPNNKINSNFILPVNATKRNKTTNQLLPILKSPLSSSASMNCDGLNNINNNNSGIGIVNTKNFNNILLGTQQNAKTSPLLANNALCKSLKTIDSLKLNQQQKLSSSSSLSPLLVKHQNQQNHKINQFPLNQKQSNNKLNSQIQHQQHHQTKIEDSLPLEAEFDWYNLDAEYGKSSNRPDIIKAADVLNGCLDEYIITNGVTNGINGVNNLRDRITNDINQSIEYNLDEEFSLSNQPDIIKENIRSTDDRKLETIPGSDPESNNSSPKKNSDQKQNECLKKSIEELNKNNNTILNDPILVETINNIEENKLKDITTTSTTNKDTNNIAKDTVTVINKFPTICDQSPCRQSVNLKQKNFVDFIDNAGLSTKPLPQQRKIYFTGPFV